MAVLPFALMVAPVPLAALVYRYGLRAGIVTALAAGVLAAILTHPVVLAQVLLGLALGIALGEGLRDGLKTSQLIGLGTLVALATTLLLIYVMERVFGVDMIEMVGLFWEEALGAGAGNSTENPEAIEALRRAIEQQMEQTRLAFPAILGVSSLALTVVDFALLRWLLAKRGEDMQQVAALRPFHLWRFPLWVALVYAGARFVEIVAAPGEGSGIVWWAVVNALLVTGTLLTVNGTAVAWHYLARIGPGIKVLIFVLALIFFQYLAMLALLVLGFIDSLANVRRWSFATTGSK